ncbi:MAG: Ig-like domain-containing protein [Pseudomonadota bacterium]
MATVVEKSSGEVTEYPIHSLEPVEGAVIKLDIGPEEVAGFEQQGTDLVVLLQSGQEVTVPGFFAPDAALRNELVLEDSSGVLWWGQYEQPWTDFSFAEIGTVDELLAGGEEAAGGGFGTAGLIAAGLGAAGIAAAAAGGGGSSSSDGGSSEPAAEPADEVEPPEVETANAEGITGSAQTDTTVILYDDSGNEISQAETDADGSWSIPADEFPGGDPDGFEGEVIAVDEEGNESDPTDVGPIDGIAPDAPQVESANADGLSGSAEAGSTVVLRDGNGDEVARTEADAQGEWSIPADEFPGGDPDGFEGEVVAVDEAGNESGPADVGPIDGIAPEAPVVESANADGLSGSAEAGSTVVLRDESGNEVVRTETDAQGEWTVAAGAFPDGNPDGFEGDVVAVDDVGNQSDPTDVGPIDGIAPDAPVVESANADGLSGSAEAGSTVVLSDGSGNRVAQVDADAQGDWSVPPDPFPGGDPNGFVGEIIAVDDAGNVSDPTDVGPINADAPAAPVILDMTVDGMVGTSEANSTITLRNIDGDTVATAQADAAGDWSIGAPQFDVADPSGLAGYEGTLTATDEAGNASVALGFTFPDAPAIPEVLQQDDAAIGGTVDLSGQSGEVTVVLENAAGDVVGETVADGSGNWVFTAQELTDAGYDIVGFDGRVSARNEAGFISQDADVSVASLFAKDDAATADVIVDTSAGTSDPEQLEDMVLSGGILGIGVEDATSQEFVVDEGNVGALTFNASSGSVLELLSQGFSIELQKKNASGEYETVGSLSEDSGLLGADLLGLIGTDEDISQEGIPAGEYNLVLSRDGGVELLSGDVSLTDMQLYQFNPDEVQNATVVGAETVEGNLVDDDVMGDPDTDFLVKDDSGNFVEPGGGLEVQGDYGVLTVYQDGSYSYTPDENADNIGQLDTFEYRLEHPNGETSDATLSMEIGFVAQDEASQEALDGDATVSLAGVEQLSDSSEETSDTDTPSLDEVVVDEGDEDVLAGTEEDTTSATADAGDTTIDVTLESGSTDLFEDSSTPAM